MEIVKTTLQAFLIFLLVILFFDFIESKVRNLSCNCLHKNYSTDESSPHYCPIGTRSKLDSNWFRYCRYEGNDSCVIRAVVILPKNDSYEPALSRVLPVLTLGVEAAKERGILPKGLQFSFTPYDDECNNVYGQISALDAYVTVKPHVIFGPSCEYSVASVARMVKFWNTPLLTIGALTFDFLKEKTKCKNEFYLLVRTSVLDFQRMSIVILKILNKYHWRKALLVYEKDGYTKLSGMKTCKLMMETLVETFKNSSIQYGALDLETVKPGELKADLAKDLQLEYSIVVVCANPNTVREILLAAEELKMVDSGEYVFFNIELFNSLNNDSYTPWFNKNDTAERNERAKKAYTSLLTVTARTPENREYKKFSNEVKVLAEKNFNYSFGDDSVSTFITAFYDAVILYSLALNESLREGGSAINGNDITRRMWNRTFKGITGDVHIDDNGDRIADYSLWDMDPRSSKFEIVANYIGANKSLDYVQGKKIHWAANRESPPPDTPVCGFDGSGCRSMPEYAILSIVLSLMVFVMVVASVILFRRYKLEAEIASMTWKISNDELLFPQEKRGQGSIHNYMGRRGSQLTIISDGAISNYDGRQVFIRRAIYKGNQVAIKDIQKKNRFELNRSLLYEFKRMKDLHHDHLVRFYGACIETKIIRFVTEYCPKGSLQDILENDQFKLDWMFKFSLMQDVVRGMIYIHNSEIRSHGNLKSSNCLVDARFVLKISDFGLHSLRIPPLDLDPSDDAFWRRLLWTAPELLRMENPPLEGTQRGDVYSFGIIVHEMMTRQGTFYIDDVNMSPREIIENVKNGQKPSFRPIVDDLYRDDPSSKDVVSLMKKCWGEDPADRPDFSALKNHISKLNKENESGNILDNLLSRMEQYANNLEALVEERTSDYLEEKKKCEELLYQLLPKSVASQLIKGQSVIAETYDQVTIYFSDIVGFTSLSAESTPMQVVDLLNDLYTCFDSIIENFDVYKVETIGDAYMVVSGLPVRNGNLHAREIARMSLALLAEVRDFRIRHRPSTQLKLRIGMHTGPCVAGVVGLKMPRYCLFGDTVNTASRMESNGEALKIHVSPKTKEVLDTFKSFELEYRGKVEMKGKGVMTTYWLLGEKKLSNNNEDCPGTAPETELTSVAATTTTTTTTTTTSSNNISSPTKNNKSDISTKLANNISNQINNIENKNYNIIPNSSTPLLTNASRDSIV